MNKKIAIISAAFALSVPIMPVFAQVADLAVKPEGANRGQMRAQLQENGQTNPETTQQLQDRREQAAQKRLEFQDRKEKMAETKCKNLENKLATRIGRYENNGQMLQKVYGNMKTRLDRLSAQLKAAGVDTTKLNTDLAALYVKIDKLYADQAAFMVTLQESQTAVCGKTEGEFKTQIENARKVPEVIRQDRNDIKTFFQTTIKADLQAIRAQLAETNTTEAVKTEEPRTTTSVKVKKSKDNDVTTSTGTTSTSSSSTSTTSTSTTDAQ